jgi:MATE family multidrug resistance protein
MALSTALYGGVYWVMLEVAVSPLGPAVNAALGIGWSALEGLSWPLFHGVSLATASIVGRRLGARDPAGARRAAALSLLPTAALGLVATGLFVGFGDTVTRWFASDPEVHAAASAYAYIVGLSQLFVALEATAEGVLAGAGDTRAVFWSGTPLNVARAPLAWYAAIALGTGGTGIWWVITGTTVGKAVIKLALVARGAWARLELERGPRPSK